MTIRAGTIGRVAVDFAINTGALDTGLRIVQSRLATTFGSIAGLGDRLDRSLSRIGTRLTLGVTAPALAAGVTLAKVGSTFDATLTKIETQATATASEVARFRAAVLQLAPAVGQGPTALAEGLLRIASVGPRGALALDILERSAKAATVGFGETNTIAGLVSSALQAYSATGLTAARATDILVAAVQAGAAEAPEMAAALGNVIGIASQVGVSFEQVSAFVATFTRLGVNADEAVTALRGALLTVLSPSAQAEEALRAVGLSSEELRRQIREKGLAEAFIGLVEIFRGNEQGLTNIIENVRALSGVLGTAGAQAGTFRAVLGEITNSAGALDAAFQRTTETPAFTFQRFRVQAETLATALGDQLAPAFGRVLRAAEPILNLGGLMVRAFAALPLPIQSTVIALVAMTAAIGPLILALGAAIKVAGALVAVTLAIRLGPILLALARSTAPLVAGLASIRTAVAALPSPIGAAASSALTLFAALHPLGLLIGPIGALLGRLITFHPTMRILGLAAVALGTAIGGIGIATKGLSGSTAQANDSLQTMATRIEEVGRQAATSKGLIESLNEEANRVGTGQPPTPSPRPTVFIPPVPPPVGGFYVPPTPGAPGGAPTPTPTPPVQVPVPLGGLAQERRPVKIGGPFSSPEGPIPLGAGAILEARDAAVRFGQALQQLTADPPEVAKIFAEARTELDALDKAAKVLPPSFDLAGAKAGVIEEALKKAAAVPGFGKSTVFPGLETGSLDAERLGAQLAALTTDTTGLNREMAAIATTAAITGDGFGAWQQQVSRLEGEIQRLLTDGVDPASPAIAALEGRLSALVSAGPPVENALAIIAEQGAAIGPSFDIAGRSTSVLRGAIEDLVARGLGPGSDAIVLMQRELVRLAGDTAPLAVQLEAATRSGILFGDTQGALQEQVRAVEQRLRGMNTALVEAETQLGATDPAVVQLRQDIDDLHGVFRALHEEVGRGVLQEYDRQLAAISTRVAALRGAGLSITPGGGNDTIAELQERAQAGRAEVGRLSVAPVGETPEAAAVRQTAIQTVTVDLEGAERSLQVASAIEGAFTSVADNIASAFNQSVTGIIQGTTTVRQAFANLGQSILLSWASSLVSMTAKYAAEALAQVAIEKAKQLGLISVSTAGATTRAAVASGEATAVAGAKAVEVGAVVAGEATKTAAVSAAGATRTSLTLAEVATSIGAKIAEVATWVGGEVAKLTASLATFTVAIAGTTLLLARTVALGAAMAIAVVSTLAMAVAAPILGAVSAVAAIGILVLANAAKAAAIALAAESVASTPYIGPILAVAAAASVGSAISAAAAVPIVTAAKGALLTEDTLVQAHAREAILPARFATGLASIIDSFGPSGARGATASAYPRSPTRSFEAIDPRLLADGLRRVRAGGTGERVDARPSVINLYAWDSKDLRRFVRRHGGVLSDAARERTRVFDRSLTRR